MPHKILFVSYDALIGDTAWQCVKEGHDVRYAISTESEREIGDGFVPKVDDWEQHVEWADLIVFDDVLGHGTHAHRLRQQGKRVIGGTPIPTGSRTTARSGSRSSRPRASRSSRRRTSPASTTRSPS